jgi:hypothetical protein
MRRHLLLAALGIGLLSACSGGSTDARPSRTPPPSGTGTGTPSSGAVITDAAGNVTVSTPDDLRSAVATAHPGEVITLADGAYVFRQRLVASASGTAAAPITLRGSRQAVIQSKDDKGNYGLSITGDHWVVQGLTVAHATKGIVLDGSDGTVIDGVEVFDTGEEGVHFRSCSSDGVLRNSLVHDTGVVKPQFGEGVYVGSANSNWSGYSCDDGRDNSERTLIEGNTFRHVAAEGADLKEGTDSGTLRGNTFDDVGYSGENSADSAVDAKGNGWLVEGNVVLNATGKFADGFQVHAVYDGYGLHNTFRDNTVRGAVPGFGFGLYPAADTVVSCDDSAPQAALGLVGAAGKEVPCSS